MSTAGWLSSANRDSWNEIAPKRLPQPTGFFSSRGTTLDAFETALLPEVRGRRLLHPACVSVNESLSWAARGAIVTGVDISEDFAERPMPEIYEGLGPGPAAAKLPGAYVVKASKSQQPANRISRVR